MEFLSGNFLCETIVPKNELIVSRTDLKGIISYANETFAEISGYSVEELIGKLHNYRDWETDRKSTRLNSSHITRSRMPSSA